MSVSITLVSREDREDGTSVFSFDDKSSVELCAGYDASQYTNEVVLDEAVKDSLRQYLISWSGRNGKKIKKTITFDIDANSGNIVRIQ